MQYIVGKAFGYRRLFVSAPVPPQVEKPHPVKCMTFGQSPQEERRLATGDFHGNLHIWWAPLTVYVGPLTYPSRVFRPGAQFSQTSSALPPAALPHKGGGSSF